MKNYKLKILIVDDNPKFLEMFQRNLESKNCLVQTACDQKTALSKLINESFHVVFIDCILNKGQGIELVQDIKKILGYSVEIILMSGVVRENSVSGYIDTRVSNFLSKPISEKDLTETINRTKEKYLFGNKKNLLDKFFSHETSVLHNLKFLVSKKKAKDYELYLYIHSALSSGEHLIFKFQHNNKKYKIICNKGKIVDYQDLNLEVFLNMLLSKNYITKQDAIKFTGKNQPEIIQSLLQNSILSPKQIQEIKYELFSDVLKKTVSCGEIDLEINFTPPKQESSILLDQSEYADLIFLLLKYKSNQQLCSLFDDQIMDKSLVFKNKLPHYPPEIQVLIYDLKQGMKLKKALDKHINNKSSFYHYIIYILLKGNVFLSKTNMHVQHQYLYERYQSLYKFLNETKSSGQIFTYLKALPKNTKMNKDKITQVYHLFVKNNHPDIFPFDIPSDLFNLMNSILVKIKDFYKMNDGSLKELQDKKHKQEQMEKDVLLVEKKKICERYLEEQKYKEAFSLIKTIPKEVLNTNLEWQLLYLWINLKTTLIDNITDIQKYIKNIQAQSIDLKKEKLYYYIIGLHYKNNGLYKKAKHFFQKAQSLDPYFRLSYVEIKECSIQMLEHKNKHQHWNKKLKSFFSNNSKKIIKKTG